MPATDIPLIKKQLLKDLTRLSFKRKKVVLSSGKISNYYFDARISSLSGPTAYYIARVILDMIKKDRIDAVGGLTLGADPIVGAVVALSHTVKKPLNGFIVRKSEKSHGMKKLVEGPLLKKSSRVVIIDDVVTTGSSTVQAIEAIKTIGCKIVRVIAVVDRLDGAQENIQKFGLKLEPIFTIRDFNV
ncbi:MAG: orotate phosphoribosyltransferase [Candidatus Omnitrophica bacterium]|nr:orotate phosphoribosyltransferase [Candidatus Omnitrophota bacterium]